MLTLRDINRALDRLDPEAFVPRTRRRQLVDVVGRRPTRGDQVVIELVPERTDSAVWSMPAASRRRLG